VVQLDKLVQLDTLAKLDAEVALDKGEELVPLVQLELLELQVERDDEVKLEQLDSQDLLY